MRIGIIPASELSTTDLRASRYVVNPKKMARDLISQWSTEFGGIATTRSKAGQRLQQLVEAAIREGMKKR